MLQISLSKKQTVSDDSAVVVCISEEQEGEYRALVDNLVDWTGQNHLRLNIGKTRELVIDFRRKLAFHPLCNLERDVEAVGDYKYLCIIINHRLDWRYMELDLCQKKQTTLL